MFRSHGIVATVLCALALARPAAVAAGQASSAAAAPTDPVTVPIPYTGPPPPIPPATVTRDETGHATLRAVRLTRALRLDGLLDEDVYKTIPAVSDFIQTEPVFGIPASQKTEVWILFDDANLYISARCWEDHPERMVINEMRRDATNIGQNERLGVTIDTFYDRRNGATFSITPIGGRSDGQITDERQYNSDWNPVWDLATGRFDGGWTAEVVIPFKSLRYRAGRSQIWGIQIGRLNRWKNESTYLTPIPPALATRGLFQISVAPTLVGLEVPEGAKNLEIKPYGISDLTSDAVATPKVSNDLGVRGGFDLKYGITQNLTADFTYNTDFAQVEADEQQVNLSRFNLFFPEKREFFLENQGTFSFGGAAAAFGDATTVTDTPVLFYSRRIGLNQGRVIPIELGGRVTGRVGRYSVGLLDIRAADEAISGTPATNFAVLRLKRDILRRSNVGVMYTDRSVGQSGGGRNRAYGVDGTFAFFDNLTLTTFWARTENAGISEHNTSHRALLEYAGDRYGVQMERLTVGEHFTPDLGFVRRDDINKNYGLFRFSPRPRKGSRVRKYTWTASLSYIENNSGRLVQRDQNTDFAVDFQNGDRFISAYADVYEFVPQPFRIAGDIIVPVGGYNYGSGRIGYTLGPQRTVSGTFQAEYGPFYSGHKTTVSASRGRLNINPKLSVEPGFSINLVTLREGSFTAQLVTSRVTYTMTPRMFVSALIQYATSTNTAAANLRLRWEYRPGSEFFVVFNEQRDTLQPGFPRLANRTLIVKFNRLVRF